MIAHIMEMLKVVEDPIQYLDSLDIPYSVKKIQRLDPIVPDTIFIKIEYKGTKYIVCYYMFDGVWFYVQ